MYSLITLFALVPLYFSHILAPFGVIIGETSSFERQKMYLFTFLIFAAFLEILWTRYDILFERFKKNWMYFILLLAIPFLSLLLWGTKLDADFFFGSFEKHHGYFFFAGLILLLFFLQVLGKKEKDILIKVSLMSGLFVSLFALLEYLGYSLFFHGLSGANWGSGRSISTLGNPNYLAGYLLMLLPLVRTIRQPERYVLGTLFVMAILSTQSVIAVALLILYGASVILGFRSPKQNFYEGGMARNPAKNKDSLGMTRFLHAQEGQKGKYIQPFVVLATGFIVIISGYFLLPPDKLLSLMSRFVLMRETLSIIFQYPLSLLVGFGPDTIIHAYEGTRSAVIDAYFPRGSAIDSSHNLVIDVLFQFGIIPIVLVPYFLWKNWKNISLAGREGLLLGLGFLSLNPYVISHTILLVLLTSLYDRKNTEH